MTKKSIKDENEEWKNNDFITVFLYTGLNKENLSTALLYVSLLGSEECDELN